MHEMSWKTAKFSLMIWPQPPFLLCAAIESISPMLSKSQQVKKTFWSTLEASSACLLSCPKSYWPYNYRGQLIQASFCASRPPAQSSIRPPTTFLHPAWPSSIWYLAFNKLLADILHELCSTTRTECRRHPTSRRHHSHGLACMLRRLYYLPFLE
jgi:hypothetical protein